MDRGCLENDIDTVGHGIARHRGFLLCLTSFNELLHVYSSCFT